MPEPVASREARTQPAGLFVTTRWTQVLAAGRTSDTTHARAALEQLCQTYWYPIYAFVRRQGHAPHDAQDLTQSFFACLLERNALGAVDRERGRFRSFLLATLKNFLRDEWDKLRAQKRGGGQAVISLDAGDAESRYSREPADTLTADRIFERRWALLLLDRAVERLRAEHEAAGKLAQFEALKASLAGSRESQPYTALATQLGLSKGAVKVAVHRLRQRYREVIRAEIAETVASEAEVEAELKHLMAALA
ncbi:MAG: sigma-70 family RNA polymerase sigma factor [Verrucomicrobia bacterium]|nr:sigma-70 family RNA polymerase sigma factor [Verrucomicrobiota bacterium]NBU09785.1 sigma-70 family RNA polymerase sigma factor [Pseudomonadota bacterium]NDA69090.1 sigma-70 family RNA polymerase sigma factor [Verrucomicrobiota bacterium]NDB75277.1 sigma-70 family RNA polymerase sigma factor [Verrucomicrobiota bacterium]NDD40578.1 sigma-70 family RNA polymerase sigma factor [Verrucomicrobiota bacterium]